MKLDLIGADPELFACSMANDQIVSAIGTMCGGTKDKPYAIGVGHVQEDNVLAEFNIPPCSTKSMFIDMINTQQQVVDMLLSHHMMYSAIRPHHTFDIEYLKQQGEKALEFGCDPDYNAYTEDLNPPPHVPGNPGFRSASGHIHVGIKDFGHTGMEAFAASRAMDIYLGIPSVLLDEDRERRKLYGKAGACRVKEYGVEYRVLSNFWLANNNLIGWVYDQTATALDAVDSLEDIYRDVVSKDEVQRIINEYDEAAALKVCETLKIAV